MVPFVPLVPLAGGIVVPLVGGVIVPLAGGTMVPLVPLVPLAPLVALAGTMEPLVSSRARRMARMFGFGMAPATASKTATEVNK